MLFNAEALSLPDSPAAPVLLARSLAFVFLPLGGWWPSDLIARGASGKVNKKGGSRTRTYGGSNPEGLCHARRQKEERHKSFPQFPPLLS